MTRSLVGVLVAVTALGACDFSGDFLFPGVVEGVPSVYVLLQDNGDRFVPVDVTSLDDVAANTIYGEVGPPVDSELGGITVDFTGTGGDVCVWVDPETVFYSQSVALVPGSDFAAKWSYPDNFYDDGDIDLFAGLSVYYTGSPGEQVGDFVVQYEDSLGNRVPVSLSECSVVGLLPSNNHSGRGMPEYCTIRATDLGISYTVLMQTYSTPLDDDRLSFGLLLTNGNCDDIRELAALAEGGAANSLVLADECVILGESIVPGDAVNNGIGPWIGRDNIDTWPGSIAYEQRFCDYDARMRGFCNNEVDDVGDCQWDAVVDPEKRCYCGDPRDTPSGGAF